MSSTDPIDPKDLPSSVRTRGGEIIPLKGETIAKRENEYYKGLQEIFDKHLEENAEKEARNMLEQYLRNKIHWQANPSPTKAPLVFEPEWHYTTHFTVYPSQKSKWTKTSYEEYRKELFDKLKQQHESNL